MTTFHAEEALAEELMAPWVRANAGWVLRLDTEHVITVTFIGRKWMWRWQRGPGLTIHESLSHPTMGDCMRSLWLFVFEMFDDYYRRGIEETKHAHLERCRNEDKSS